MALSVGRDAHGGATAEWIVGALLAVYRHLPSFVRAQDEARWDHHRTEELAGKRLLIIGAGDVAEHTVRRLAPFGTTGGGRSLAALDVTDPEPLPADHPLWRAPGLLLTPHVGGSVPAAMRRAYRVAATQIAAFARGEQPQNLVENGYRPATESRPPARAAPSSHRAGRKCRSCRRSAGPARRPGRVTVGP